MRASANAFTDSWLGNCACLPKKRKQQAMCNLSKQFNSENCLDTSINDGCAVSRILLATTLSAFVFWLVHLDSVAGV